MKRKKGGFTLVELIVVIVIILVLAAVLVPSLLRYVSKAKNAAAINECSEVLQAAARTAVDLHLRLLYSLKTMMQRSYLSDIYRKAISM